MDQKIIDYYADIDFHIPKLIQRKPVDLRPEQVEAGAESLYLKILGGLKIKKINIARLVWGEARRVNCAKYVEDNKLLLEAKRNRDIYAETVVGYDEIIDHHKKRNTRLTVLSTTLIILVVLDQAYRWLL